MAILFKSKSLLYLASKLVYIEVMNNKNINIWIRLMNKKLFTVISESQ